MPFPKRIAVLAIASATLLAAAIPSSAFSKLGREDGSLPTEDGVVSTPLPPLGDSNAKPATTTQGSDAGAPAGGAENSGAQQPATSEPSAVENAPPQTGAGGGNDPTTTGATQDKQQAAPDGATPPPTAQPDEDDSPGDDAAPSGGGAEEGTDPASSQQATPQEPAGPPPDVVYGDSGLPTPVRDLRAKLMEIAKSGDIEQLRPYIEPGDDGTVISFGGVQGDPIEYLKSSSGDGEGVETLAILLEVLQAGHILSEPNTENEIYVWPYFSGLAIDKLTKPQKVELFELVTAGDYQEMVGFGAYNFYRVGISPDGKLQFFVAGD